MTHFHKFRAKYLPLMEKTKGQKPESDFEKENWIKEQYKNCYPELYFLEVVGGDSNGIKARELDYWESMLEKCTKRGNYIPYPKAYLVRKIFKLRNK